MDLVTFTEEIWSHLLKKSLMENFIFCAVSKRDFLASAIEGLYSVFGLLQQKLAVEDSYD